MVSTFQKTRDVCIVLFRAIVRVLALILLADINNVDLGRDIDINKM